MNESMIMGVCSRKCTYPGVKSNTYLITKHGGVYSLITNKFLKPRLHDGYLYIDLLACGERRRIIVSVHRLVAWEFVPNPHKLPIVDHLDGVKTNNCDTDLEWVSIRENVARAARSGLLKNHSYDENIVRFVCEKLELGLGVVDIFRLLLPEAKTVEDDVSLWEKINEADRLYRKIKDTPNNENIYIDCEKNT